MSLLWWCGLNSNMPVKYQGGLKWQIWIEIRVKSQGVVNSRAGKMHINTVVYFHKSIHSSEKIVFYLRKCSCQMLQTLLDFWYPIIVWPFFLAFSWNISSIMNLPFLLKMDRICTIILLQIKEDLGKTHFRFLETRHITMLHCVFNSWI